MRKLILLLFLICSTSIQLFAQANDLKARAEYEEAEQAYSNGNYSSVLEHLSAAENFLGSWNAKIGHTRIKALDKLVVDEQQVDRAAELKAEIKKYMDYANKNAASLDKDKFKDVYAIEQKIIGMEEYGKANAVYASGNYAEAFNAYKKIADKGYGPAMFVLGEMYRTGTGIPQNDHESYFWYWKAADKGIAEAMYRMGKIYEQGIGVSPNKEEAEKWFSKAANAGYQP